MSANSGPTQRAVGRILVNGREVGTAFTVAGRAALTAGHVVRAVTDSSGRMDRVVYVPEGGSPIAIGEIQRDQVLDVALALLDDDAPQTLAVAKAVNGMSWRVQSRPRPNDPTLTGTVTDHLRDMHNAQGEATRLVQLLVQQEVGDYGGYSGSPIIAEDRHSGAVIGVLVEQGRWRRRAQSGETPVSNVLYAAPIDAVISRFGLWQLVRSQSVHELSHFGTIDGFVPPPDEICDRIRQSIHQARPAGTVVFTGRSGYGKTGLAGWAARDREIDGSFDKIVVIEFKDDWPETSRGELALQDFRNEIGAAQGAPEEWNFDRHLVSGSTLLIFDDVRSPSDLKPFFGLFDKCTVLVTALYSRIATELTAEDRPQTHFNLASPAESGWVKAWARKILTRSWPLGTATGDLVERGGSWPLLAARLNREVLYRAASQSSLVEINRAIATVDADLSRYGSLTFDVYGNVDRSVSVEASVELMLEGIRTLRPPPTHPDDRFKELGALPADVMVPVEVLDELWESGDEAATRRLVERLSDMGIIQFDRPEVGSDHRGRIRLHDSDREYLREKYPEHITEAHRRLLSRADQDSFRSPAARGYWIQHRTWHLIGAEEYEKLTLELSDPEWLVNAALSRTVQAIEHDLALLLAYCPPSRLRNKDQLFRKLQRRIRQSVDVLDRCRSRESFCPTLAARLQGEPELASLVAGLSHYAEGAGILVQGPPHDMDDRRLIRRLPKPGTSVRALAWLAGPDRIGIAYRDGSACLWEPRTDQLHKGKQTSPLRAAVARWSQSGGEVAIGRSDGTLTVWPTLSGAAPEALQGQGVACLAWSKKGELAYGGWHGDLACWSPSGGTHRPATENQGVPVTALAWHDAGAQLAFATAQGAVFIFSDGSPVKILPVDQGGAASLAWSSKGLLACAGWDGTVRVVQPDGQLCDMQPEPSDRRGPPTIAWDHDGERLAIGGYDGAVAIWCHGGRKQGLPPEYRAVRALAWSPTAPFLAVAHDGGVIRIWRDTDREDDLPPIRVQGTAIVDVAWSWREHHLAAAGADGTVTMWSPFGGNDALRAVIRTDGPTMVRCSPDGRTVATAEEAGSVRLWDVQTREAQALPWRAARKQVIGWAPSRASLIAIGGADGVVHEWAEDMRRGSRIVHEHSAWVSDLAWGSNGQLATLGRDWMLHISQPSCPPCIFVPHEGGTTAMAWSSQGSLLATAGNDWLVRVWRPPTVTGAARELHEQWSLVAQFRAHLGGVTGLAWSPEGTELATAGWDRSVRRWQLRLPSAPLSSGVSYAVSWRLTDTWHTPASAVSLLAWSPDGTTLAGGDRRGHLQTWRYRDSSNTHMRSSHEGPLTALRWSQKANRILSTGIDGTLRLWDIHGKECACIFFHAPLYSLDLHDDSGLVAVGGEYGATILQL